jgi:hypothetical protein
MAPPTHPKIYHIVHVDKLASIIGERRLVSDAAMREREPCGTVIGMRSIKDRRLHLPLTCHPDLMVGACVPFYFCSRSVMLYLMYPGNHPELSYRGGQEPIIHLEADLHESVAWATDNGVRWAFTLSNAGSHYFEDRASLDNLDDLDWEAIEARQWSGRQEAKQAEFLMEGSFPWHLIRRIGVYSPAMAQRVESERARAAHKPPIQILRNWYY